MTRGVTLYLFDRCIVARCRPLTVFFTCTVPPPLPLPPPAFHGRGVQSEMVALFKVDTAYGEVMASADGQLKSWRQTVGSGRVVSDFGERVSDRHLAVVCY